MKKLIIILLLIPFAVFGQTQIKTSQINPTLPANLTIHNNAHKYTADSIYLGSSVATRITPTGSMTFFGTSITAGVSVTGSGTRYSTQVANALGLTEINLGTAGQVIEKQSPIQTGLNAIDNMVNITTYSAGVTRWLIIEPGPNDFQIGLANYTPTNYQTDLTTVINYCISTKGWPASKILILNNSYILSSFYTGGFTLVNYQLFQAKNLAVANSLGTLYFDLYSWFNVRGADFLMFNTLHPNDYGHTVMANGILTVLQPATVYATGQPLAVNGTAEFSSLKLDNGNILPDAGNYIAGIDASGNIQKLGSLPLNTRFLGNGYVAGGLITTGVSYTFTPGTQDWIFGQNKLYGQYATNTAYYTTLQLCNSSVGYTFQTSFNTPTAAMASFTNGAGTTLTTILQNGTINTSNITVPAGGNSLNSTLGGGIGKFEPFNGSNNTNIGNSWSGASVTFQTSRGSTGTFTEAGRFSPNGNLLLNTTTDDGFNLEVVNASRFQGALAIGRLATPTLSGNPTTSTSGGTTTAGTYYYKVVPIDALGNQGLPSNEGSVTTTGSTSSNTVNWGAVTNATSYRIYRGTSAGAENQYITSSTNSVVDIGSGFTSASVPTQNQTRLANISSAGVATIASETITTAPTTSAATYDLLTRNTSTGVVEKVASSNLSWLVSSNDLLAQTAAVANVTTPYTVGASTGTFRIGGYVNITAVTLDVIQFQCAFTDENNASQTLVFYPMGATAAGLSTTGFNALSDATIRCKNGTTITIKTVLTTGTGSIAYDVGCQVQQLR